MRLGLTWGAIVLTVIGTLMLGAGAEEIYDRGVTDTMQPTSVTLWVSS